MAYQLVTGGSGYFGSVLVKRLASQGARVRIFDLFDAHDRPDGVEFVQGDIRDPEAVARACRGADAVHHNVALVPLAKDRSAFWSVNTEGTRTLLEACLAEGVRKVIYTSSSAVFGVPERNPVDDTVLPRPREAYGKAKLAAEVLCAEYVRRGLDVTIIRPRTIIGAGRLGIMQVAFEWIRTGRNVPVLGDGRNIYQFVHASDLADACLRAAGRPGAATYNIGAAEFGTMRETLEGLIAHAGTASRVVSLPMAPAVIGMSITSAIGLSPLAPYHALMYGRSMYFDISRPRDELQWAPRYSNAEMFAEAYDWYVSNRESPSSGAAASHHRSAVKQGVLRAVGWMLRLR